MKTIGLSRSRGQILVIVAVISIVLVGFAALAIDSGLTYGVKAKLNAAVDAAAVAAARATVVGADDATRQDNAVAASTKFFNLNFPSGYLGATPSGLSTVAVHQADGRWQVTVSADAVRPTFLMGVLGLQSMTVHAEAQSVRRNVDMMLVVDTSGSLGTPYSPAATFGQVRSAAVNFVSKFAPGPGGDRVGLVVFASGAQLKVALNNDTTRGFDMAAVTGAINALGTGADTSPSGSTASAEAMRIAHDEIDRVNPTWRSSLRVIVFFSDGAPNDVPAAFPCNPLCGGTQATVSGDLYSDAPQPGNTIDGSQAASYLYDNSRRDTQLGRYTTLARLPDQGFSTIAYQQAPVAIPLASYDAARSFVGWPTPSRCNVNIAARNMVENVANTIRGEGVYVYTLGLGAFLNQLEARFTNCNYTGSTEFGARILQRLANTPDPADPKVARNPNQPVGMYVYAADAAALDGAFNAIASEILRLTR
jgi:Flp pilus assembly protein TadG